MDAVTNDNLFGHGEKVKALAQGRKLYKTIGGKRQAVGDLTFTLIPLVTETITINGTVFTLIANGGSPSGNQIALGTNLTTTIDAIVTKLNASADAAVSQATYSNVGGTKLHIVYDLYGTVGNAFTTVENVSTGTFGAATLVGGTDADSFKNQHAVYSLTTQAGGLTEFDLVAGDEGQEILVYLATKGSGSNAKINGAFSGGTGLTLDTVGKFAKLVFLGATWCPIANTGTIA